MAQTTENGYYVYGPWPCTKSAYPRPNEPGSWHALEEECRNTFAVKVKLGGRRTKKRTGRPKGRVYIVGLERGAAWKAYLFLLKQTKRYNPELCPEFRKLRIPDTAPTGDAEDGPLEPLQPRLAVRPGEARVGAPEPSEAPPRAAH